LATVSASLALAPRKISGLAAISFLQSREAVKAGNTFGHQAEGQNVLFLDNHVNFEKNSFCGINDDNIYTSWDGQDIRRGVPPKLGSQPADRLDSLLVNDPPVPR